MKKLLTILILLLAVCNLSINAEVVYSGDAHNVGNWSAMQLPINKYPVLAKAQAGDVIAVTVTAVETGARVTLQTIGYQGFADEYDCGTGVHYFVLTDNNATEVATNGITITGEKYSFTKVELLYKNTTIWTGSVDDNTGWKQSGGLSGSTIFANLEGGARIGVTISAINDGQTWHQYAIRKNQSDNVLSGSVSSIGTYVHTLTTENFTDLRANDFDITAQYLCVSELCTYVENLPTRTFTYDISPSEGGTVEVRLGGTEGEVTTETEFPRSTQLGVIAKPASGYQFEKWKLSNGEDDTVITTASFVCTLEDNIHKTAVFTATSTKTEKTLLESNVVCGSTETGTTAVPGYKFKNAAAGDEIVVKLTAVGNDAAIVPKNPSNYGSYLGDNYQASIATNATEYRLTLTDDMITTLKSLGLQVYGKNLTIGVVALYTESALGTESDTRMFTYNISPEGSGTVEVRIGGTDGEITTATSFLQGTQLTVTAKPNNGYQFVKWNEDNTTDATFVCTLEDNIQKTAVFASTPVFDTNGKADLSKLVKQAEATTVSVSDGKATITTQQSWTGVQLTVADGETVSGKEVKITLSEAKDLKVVVKNTDSTEKEFNPGSTKELLLEFDETTSIYQIQIQPKEADTFVIEEIKVNAANTTYALTTEATNGKITVSPESSDGKYVAGTELTLTATPNNGYSFSKWQVNGTDAGTSTSLTHKMAADVTIKAVFEEKPGLLAYEEKRELWSSTDGVALDWSAPVAAQPASIGDILEEGEILIFTTAVADGKWGQIQVRDASSNDVKEGDTKAYIGGLANGENRLKLSAAFIEQMKGGFSFVGEKATLTKLELYKPTPITALEEEETKTLWSNTSGTALTWNTIAIDRAAEWGAVLEEDERIIISVKAKETGDNVWPTVQLQNDTEKIASTANLLNDLTVPCDITITLTAEMVNKMKNGFSITGDKATITKAELYKPTMPAKTVHTLNSTETAISGDANVTVPAAKFANISAYDVLTVNFAITASPAKVILKGNGENSGWDYLKEMEFESGETLFALPLTPAMTSNLKKNGLQITGSGYTFKSVSIKTAGEVPSDEEKKKDDEEKKDDDDDETIIDEKTGEADLTVLSAQDDSKTTLTENEDGSITMTTTEPYCAAQIWFSDPEPVAGNVLKVELAESSVNVTVTVKYTDGTESQMSANTMVAKARGETRSASGTTVEVPLESGKEVQNIEVKNNVAGTITIKKMQVTTVNVFTNGVANLSMLKPQSNATYDTAAHTLATTKGWTGATISPVANENVSGKELLIEFADASKVKVAVKYRKDVEGPSTIMEKAAKAVRLALDNSKNIQEISIQPTEASIVTFKKIAVNSEESDDGSLKPGKTITLWENAAGETLAWNEVAKQDASVGETLKEYDELLITVSGVTKDCDWPKVFIRDASSEQAGNEVLLNDVGSFPYTVRIVLTGEMAQQLKKGFSICGDGVTVTKLQVYRPEAPKPGDIHLADLNYGYNSSYDKGTHTITTTARWAARGWEIGDKRYNDKNLITVKFEAVDFPVTLKMEYTTGLQTAQATSVGVPAGRTELLLEIPSGISKLNRVYIIYENPGSVKLTEASVTYQDNLKLSTAIRSFEADGVIRDGRYDTDGWYNLRGMRIPEPKTSGVYIHGGKKVVIY